MRWFQSLAKRERDLVGYRNPNGTRLLMQWTCVCDCEHYVDAVNVHTVQCGQCGRVYDLSTHIAFQPPIGGFTPLLCPVTLCPVDEE